MGTTIISGPWLPPPILVYKNATGDEATGTLKPDDANEKQDLKTRDQQQQVYYRRLIRRRFMDLLVDVAIDDPDIQGNDVPDSVWYLKLYGPDIKVVTTMGIPTGWILVDRKTSPFFMFFAFLIYRS